MEIPIDIERKLKAVIRRIEEAAAFDGVKDKNFNEATSLNALVRLSGMSERSLRSWFKTFTGQSISQYAGRRRTEYAARIFRLFPETSKSKVSEIIGLNSSQALYPFMRKNGVVDIDGLRTPNNPIDFIPLSFRQENINDCIMFYTLNETVYKESAAVEFEIENWDKIDAFIKEMFPEAIKIGDVGFAIDRYVDNKLDEGVFISGIICSNIPESKLSDKIIGDIGWRNISYQKYAVFSHKGSYESLSEFYICALQTLSQRTDVKVAMSLLIMEKYLNSPTDTPTEELTTELWIPIVT